jgi:hypothetical protein
MPKHKTAANTAIDPTVRWTKLHIGDKDYKLAYDFDALAKAEALTGLNLLSAAAFHGVTATELAGLLFSAVLKAQPDTTFAEIKSLMKPENLPVIMTAVVDTWNDSMPDPDHSKDPNGEALAEQSGPTSEIPGNQSERPGAITSD